ncbi:MAG: GNAT family N-acetyltransferase [Micromonosporaceae bacterium]|nr:GNAT family N-acetyltransferase [Micromonosporaceae bacterium]
MISSVTGEPVHPHANGAIDQRGYSVAVRRDTDEHLLVEFVTARLLLRELTDADHASVHGPATDPEVTRYTDWGPNTPQATAAFLAEAQRTAARRPRTHFTLAVVERRDGGLIGTVGLGVTSPEQHRGQMGYWVARPHWGCGYATAAARSVLDFAFDQLKLHKVVATCDPENAASARVLEKIGMQREGYLRGDRLIRGQWRDRLLFAAIAAHE